MRIAAKTLAAALLVLTFVRPAFGDDAPAQDPAMSRPPVDKDGSRIPERLLKPEREKESDEELDGRFAFDFLKKLAGAWRGSLPGGDTSTAQTFEVLSAGSVLVGKLFPATDQEVLSLFCLEGEELIVTLFDPTGAHPRLRFDAGKSYPGRYFFKFAGGTGFDKSKDRHVHEGSIQFLGMNQIAIEWVSYDGLSRAGSRTVNLDRDHPASEASGSH